MSKQVQF